MLKPQTEEKRGSPRIRVDRLARMEFGNGMCSRYCYVSDISKGGLRLYTYGFKAPDEFVLFIAGDGPATNGTYRVAWRRGQEIGVRFICAITHRPSLAAANMVVG
jgi:hypothetical protein